MSLTVLIGPPGVGCSAVAQALANQLGANLVDVGCTVAQRLGVDPNFAIAQVGEARYRSCEADVFKLSLSAPQTGAQVVAAGSGWINTPGLAQALAQSEAQVICLSAVDAVLAQRNGLNVPRSAALGTVRRDFLVAAHERLNQCRALASFEIDTSKKQPQQVVAEIMTHLKDADARKYV